MIWINATEILNSSEETNFRFSPFLGVKNKTSDKSSTPNRESSYFSESLTRSSGDALKVFERGSSSFGIKRRSSLFNEVFDIFPEVLVD